MDGQPVWLASVSRWISPVMPLAVPRWSRAVLDEAEQRLRDALLGVGNNQRERLFRMNVTLCLHRAATDAEVEQQPGWFHTSKACGLAGGPVEVLWENVPGSASTKPCEHPRKRQLNPGDPLLWLPIDCGRCKPCKARAAIV
jgi:hypothetical protein